MPNERLAEAWLTGARRAPRKLDIHVRRYQQLAVARDAAGRTAQILMDREMNSIFDTLAVAADDTLSAQWDRAVAEWKESRRA